MQSAHPSAEHGLKPIGGQRWIAACPVAATLRRAIVPVQVSGRQLAVLRDGHDVYAIERACPHDRADLSLGHCARGRIFCPRHRASFDLLTGEISSGWQSPALRRYPTRISDGEVMIGLDPSGHPQEV